MTTLPTGPAVTFFFSDIESSTRLAHELDADAWEALLADHDQLVDDTVAAAGGVVVKHEGDGVFAAFDEASGAISAAVAFSRRLARFPEVAAGRRARVRIGLHTGEGRLTATRADYVGIDVHYAARVSASANGGQIALSDSTVAALGGGAIPDGVRIEAVGPRRLKDFEEPRTLYLLMVPGAADDERPLRTMDAPTNLPTPPTNFVGRETDLAVLSAAIRETRLLTLGGPGGTGKTRLALAVAASVADRFPGGTWFVDFAPVRDPGLIPSTIATAVGVAEEPGVPISRTLHAHLQPLVTLLVLDNLEQLLPDAGTDVAELLRSASGLRIVVTSRAWLGIAGEREYVVEPLDPENGVGLFVDRARLVRPDSVTSDADLAAARKIVERLEGLPLAIELAAARTKMFAPAVINDRLGSSFDLLAGGTRDLPERQRTLRGAIAWSHDLLSAEEQAIFRRCAVFEGGWDAERAQEVIDPTAALGLLVVDGLESLSDKSFVRIETTDHGEPRFKRHTLLFEFARERLEHAGERDDCERRHARAFLTLAEDAGPHLTGADSSVWLDRLGHEKENIRAAMRWSLAVAEPELGLRILAATWRYWQLTSQFAEGAMWARDLLAHPAAGRDPRAQIGALAAQGSIAYWANDFATTRAAYTQRLHVAQELGDELEVAEGHYDLGFVGVVENDVEFLQEHETIALEIFERLGVHNGVVRARQANVLVHFLRGEYREARDLEVLNFAQFEKAGARLRMSDSLSLLAVASIFIDDLPAARDYLTRSLRLTSGVLTDELAGLVLSSHYALRAGHVEDAARLAGAAQAISLETGVTNAALKILHLPDPAGLAGQRLGEAADAYLAEGRAMSLEDAVLLARSLTETSEAATARSAS
ncbi:MAG: ATP-binding protein [Chloroflexota bacterium]